MKIQITIPGGGPPGTEGLLNTMNMWLLYIKWRFFLHCQKWSLKGWLIKLGCHFFSTWYYLKQSSILKTHQFLKISNIYTYQEGKYVDIVRLLAVYQAKGYMYCTLYFFTRNKISTVNQIFNTNDYTIWRIMDNKEYDERMSMCLWQELDNDDDLLDFAH